MKFGRAPTTCRSSGIEGRMPCGNRWSRLPRPPGSVARRDRLLESHAVIAHPATGPKVGIIGLSFVGLPLAVAFAEGGADVLGLDVDAPRVREVNAGRSYIEDVSSERLAELTSAGRIRATSDPSGLADRDAILICLPTPLDEHRAPDLSYVLAGAEIAIAHLAPGALLVLES